MDNKLQNKHPDEAKRKSYKVLFFIVAFLIGIYSISHGLIFDFVFNRIAGGNVGNTLFKGDFVVINTKPSKLIVGDIVLYENPSDNSELRIANIVGITKSGFFVNNRFDYEKLISREIIRGKATYILYSPSRSQFFLDVKEGSELANHTSQYKLADNPIKTEESKSSEVDIGKLGYCAGFMSALAAYGNNKQAVEAETDKNKSELIAAFPSNLTANGKNVQAILSEGFDFGFSEGKSKMLSTKVSSSSSAEDFGRAVNAMGIMIEVQSLKSTCEKLANKMIATEKGYDQRYKP